MILATSLAAHTQETVIISTNAQNSDQVFYNLANGNQTSRPLAEWDLAFEITGLSSTVLVNTAKGNKIYHVGAIDEWDVITMPDVASWTALNNSETSWSEGALSHGTDGMFNLGWGTYDIQNHLVGGTELYVVELPDAIFKKLRVDGLVTGTYIFTYADLDGSNEQTGSIVKSDFTDKNFGYWDLTANAAVDREPLTYEWDLLFTKYMSDMGIWYGVAGVLHNKGVQTAQLDLVDPQSVGHDVAEGHYSTDINIIGADWKSFNGSQYVYEEERAYFVKGQDGAIWKLIFTGYGGGATGTMTFTQELMSATSVDDIAALNGQVLLYPNPAANGHVRMILDLPEDRASIFVHDMNGKVVYSGLVSGLTPLAVRELDLSGVPTGAYVVRAEHASGVTTSRLIVQ